MKNQTKTDLNNQFVANAMKQGRSYCMLNELPSRRLARKTYGVLSVLGERVIFVSCAENTLSR